MGLFAGYTQQQLNNNQNNSSKKSLFSGYTKKKYANLTPKVEVKKPIELTFQDKSIKMLTQQQGFNQMQNTIENPVKQKTNKLFPEMENLNKFKKVTQPIAEKTIQGLSLFDRPRNTIATVLKEDQHFDPSLNKIKFDSNGKVIEKVKENPFKAILNGITGKEMTNSLEGFGLSKDDIEKLKKSDPNTYGLADFVFSSFIDPLTYVGGGALKNLSKSALERLPGKVAEKFVNSLSKGEKIANAEKLIARPDIMSHLLESGKVTMDNLSKATKLSRKELESILEKEVTKISPTEQLAKIGEYEKTFNPKQVDTFNKVYNKQNLPSPSSTPLVKPNVPVNEIAQTVVKNIPTNEEVLSKAVELPTANKVHMDSTITLNKDKGLINDTQVPEQFKGDTETLLNSGINLNPSRNYNRPVKSSTKKFEFADPEIEATHIQNKGIAKTSVGRKIAQGIKENLDLFSRPIKTLKVSGENAELYKDLIRLPKIKSIASDDTIRILDDITKGLDKNTFDVFSRKVLLDDLLSEAKLGNALPNKFTPETVKSELARIDAVMSKESKEALTKRKKYWDSIKSDYVDNMKSIGIDMTDKFTKEDYFRHQVLEYMDAKNVMGTGKKLKSPTNRGFSKGRAGEYEGNINTDYLQAEYEVMSQMKHDSEVAKTIKNIESNYDISAKVRADAKAQGFKDWHEAIPEGYTTWQPREGNAFYLSKPLGEKVVDDALSLRGLTLDTVKDPKLKVVLEDIINDLKEQTSSIALGGKRKEFVVTDEIAETLNNLSTGVQTNSLAKYSKKVQSMWKEWVLTLNPRTVIKYNARNLSGDLDPIIAANPSSFKKFPKASTDLFNAFKHGTFTPELKGWYDRGGYQELLFAQEISDVNALKPFDRFKDLSVADRIKKPLAAYREFTKTATNYRESVGRYATYLDYLEQIKSGKLKNYGASKPKVVNGLNSAEDKAFKLSNDLLGAYDEVSEGGKVLRNHLIPFYSWLEVNFKRYKQIGQNIYGNATIGGKTAFTGKLVAKVGLSAAKTLVSTVALTGIMAAWNMLKYPELEDTLPEDIRSKPHIILGKDKEGNTLYFSRLGALNDFMEWFGLDTASQDIKDLLNGKKTIGEQASDMIKSPINKVVSGVSPAYKTPAELLTGKKIYPDAFNSTPIKDKKQYLAQSFGVGKEFDALTGRPHKSYFGSFEEALLYKANPKESAYWETQDLKRKFLEKKTGKGSGSYSYSEKALALYNYKLALKYKDKEAAVKYLEKYKKLGGTPKGLKTSLGTMAPGYGIPEAGRTEFMKSLTPKEKAKYKLAKQYYMEVLANQ